MTQNARKQRAALTALGYEAMSVALVSDDDAVTQAHKVRGQSLAYALVIDRSGQVRFTTTRLVEPSHHVQVHNVERAYRVTREQQRITTILYQLTERDDLAEVVQEMERVSAE